MSQGDTLTNQEYIGISGLTLNPISLTGVTTQMTNSLYFEPTGITKILDNQIFSGGPTKTERNRFPAARPYDTR